MIKTEKEKELKQILGFIQERLKYANRELSKYLGDYATIDSPCPENGIVLDPFMGAGTTGVVAVKNLRKYIGCEINPEYKEIAEKRIMGEWGLFNE